MRGGHQDVRIEPHSHALTYARLSPLFKGGGPPAVFVLSRTLDKSPDSECIGKRL